ncbi:DUF6274 family protein [Streptomyces sp. NPDC017979]|uniref:DUF6274 family protein n=1 Tax=Streptomyces sp. NPDC017979 TaxID=3365024 RepID=UPI0037880A3D
MAASTTAPARKVKALLRAHLAAAARARGYRHLTGRCPACRHLQRLACESADPLEQTAAPEQPATVPRSTQDEGPGTE